MTNLVQIEAPRDGERVPVGQVDADALGRALEVVVEGEVRFDAGSRAIFSTDASNYRQVPIGVVFPRTKDDVIRGVEVCRRFGAPVLGRGGGTSQAGQCCNVAVVLDFTHFMNAVLDIDPERRIARVQPGCVLDDLREQAERVGLTFGPDPSTHDRCALGGMIGNNASGVHSVMAQWHTSGARTSDNLHSLEVLTWDGEVFWAGETPDDELERIVAAGGRRGEIYRRLRELRDAHAGRIRESFPDIPRRVSGYNLDELLPENGFHLGRALCGTEGTCGLFLEAELHLIPTAPERTLVVLGYPDIYAGADQVTRIMEHRPLALEGMDSRLIQYMQLKGFRTGELHLLPDGAAYLLVEFGGDTREASDAAARAFRDRAVEHELAPHASLVDDPEEAGLTWELRESALGATAFVPGQPPTWPGWEDTAVHPSDLGDYLRDLRKLLDTYGYGSSIYGHFGQGLVHVRIDFDLETPRGRELYMEFGQECADLVVRYGGSLSGEHGDGQALGLFLDRMYGPELMEAFRTFKSIWDPDGKMNPGKLIDAYRPDRDLVQDWTPPLVDDQQFAFPNDEHVFFNAPMRCVGVGKCRRKEGGTMCPSYMVTRDEEYSTRGRSRIFYEMLRGEVITDGWKSEEVHRALDLCLSCKGCKSDCPVHVDMATYKAEFAYHHYQGRLRPRQAYALGLVYWWARLGSKVAGLANGVMGAPRLSGLLKWAGGIHPDRELPRFSRPTFRARFRKEWASVNPGSRTVIFWPDTFNNHFYAETAMDGARVLDALGYHVRLPERPLCCGRPLYDFGFLGLAKRLWRQILDALEEDIEEGVPVVGVEPSCIAAFRDELVELFPNDKRARRLADHTYLLGEFLEERAGDVELPPADDRVLIHGHCHQKAVLDFGADLRVLERMGVEYDAPPSGCCGMAGPFGVERDHYDVAQACGQRVLIPAVESRSDGITVLTDGFSCREMIQQNTGVRPLNLAEFVWRTLEAHGGRSAVQAPRPRKAGPRGGGAGRGAGNRRGGTAEAGSVEGGEPGHAERDGRPARIAAEPGTGARGAGAPRRTHAGRDDQDRSNENRERRREAMPMDPETRGNGEGSRDRIVRKGSGRGRRKGVVVVTGGSAGVGRAAVRAFAAAGWDVGILARGRDGLRGAAREVEQMGQAACAVPTDVAEHDQVEAAAAAVEAELGAIDVWVNNAMTTVFAPLHEIEPAEFERATRVTYLGSVWGTMAALRRMRPRNRGVICQVGSALSYRSIPLQAPYCGAKAAIRGFLDSLRSELIHDGVDVDITLVHLPAVNTPQFDWCRARLPNRPQPVPPIYQPEVAADAIVYAAEHPQREIWVGVPTWKTILGQRLSPPAMDRYLARVAWDGQQTDEPLDPERPDNLFEPVPGDVGAHGAFDARSRGTSIQMEASRHRRLLGGVALAAAGALALGMLMGRRDGEDQD